MAIAVAATRTALAATYVSTVGTFVGLATADPGTTATPASEATGGSYARVATTWSAGAAGVQNGTAVTINAAAGTYTFSFVASGLASNTMGDKCAITSTTLSSAGQIIVTPSITIS